MRPLLLMKSVMLSCISTPNTQLSRSSPRLNQPGHDNGVGVAVLYRHCGVGGDEGNIGLVQHARWTQVLGSSQGPVRMATMSGPRTGRMTCGRCRHDDQARVGINLDLAVEQAKRRPVARQQR